MRYFWVYGNPPLFSEILLPVYIGPTQWVIHWERSCIYEGFVYLEII
jgi:hypothetical protein